MSLCRCTTRSLLAPLFPARVDVAHRVGPLYERDAEGCAGPSCAIDFVGISDTSLESASKQMMVPAWLTRRLRSPAAHAW
jgi:hypothetical protein